MEKLRLGGVRAHLRSYSKSVLEGYEPGRLAPEACSAMTLLGFLKRAFPKGRPLKECWEDTREERFLILPLQVALRF